MRVLVLVKATAASEAGAMPSPALWTAMGRFNEQLLKAGVLLAAEGLQPSARGKRVRFGDGGPAIIDGPFAETKEVLAGYNLIEADSLEQAIELASRFPWARYGSMEVRPVADMEAERERVGA